MILQSASDSSSCYSYFKLKPENTRRCVCTQACHGRMIYSAASSLRILVKSESQASSSPSESKSRSQLEVVPVGSCASASGDMPVMARAQPELQAESSSYPTARTWWSRPFSLRIQSSRCYACPRGVHLSELELGAYLAFRRIEHSVSSMILV
jgi:hypothetical protein